MTSRMMPAYLSRTLSLPKAEQDILGVISQCLAKILNHKRSSDWMDYLVSRVCNFLLYNKWYVLKLDIGQNKLKQMNEKSCIDLSLTDKVIFIA